MTFFNPYAFVRAPARTDPAGAWGDGPPDALGALDPARWTGRLRLRLTAHTPLLVTEQERTNDKTTRWTRSIRDTVALLPTSVKGMLRTEYEMVTNSRFGVFDGHDRRLGYRSGTRDSRDLVPARVVDDGEQVELLKGTNPGNAMLLSAAWVPRFGANPLNVTIRTASGYGRGRY